MKTTSRQRLVAIVVLLLALGSPLYAGEVTLAWDPNTEPDLAGYIVHYGSQSGIYSNRIDVGNRTSWAVTGLADGRTYYFAVQAYNAAGVLSPMSAEVSAEMPASVTPRRTDADTDTHANTDANTDPTPTPNSAARSG